MLLTRVNNLGWMRVHSDNVALYLRCFGVNPAYLREMIPELLVEAIDENGGGPGVRLRKRQRAKQSK